MLFLSGDGNIKAQRYEQECAAMDTWAAKHHANRRLKAARIAA